MSEQPLSPQGYNIKDRPVNANPFWETSSPAEEIGEVTAVASTLETGVPATATVESIENPGTGKTDLRFSFGIPEGEAGEPGRGIGEVTAAASTLETGEPATATVESVDNPGTGKTDLRFSFGIPGGEPGEAGEPGRGIGVVAAETNAESGVGVHVRETENVQNNEVDLTFHFDFPTEGGSQSLEFVLLGSYLEENQPPDSLVSRMREFPVVGFGVAYLGVGEKVTSHDIQTLIPTSELTSMPDIHLCKTFPTNYGCNAVLCVVVSPRSNGTAIVYNNYVKYTAGLTRIAINGKTYYVNATTADPDAYKYFGLCVWGIRLKE